VINHPEVPLSLAVEAYQRIIPQIDLGNDYLYLKDVIQHVRAVVSEKQQKQQIYHVLLIITSKEYSDYDDIYKQVLECYALGISVIFVSVGNWKPSEFI
jgi:hypothetical protein